MKAAVVAEVGLAGCEVIVGAGGANGAMVQAYVVAALVAVPTVAFTLNE